MIRDGMVFESVNANRALRGHREILVTHVNPAKYQVTVQDLRTGGGWRMSTFSLENGNRWRHTCDAWEVLP